MPYVSKQVRSPGRPPHPGGERARPGGDSLARRPARPGPAACRRRGAGPPGPPGGGAAAGGVLRRAAHRVRPAARSLWHPFQQKVWSALRSIPFGETRTYAEVATQIGHPGAARAVGAASGRNPLSIVAPCHRVVGTSGELTGFAGGLEVKARLLAFERAG